MTKIAFATSDRVELRSASLVVPEQNVAWWPGVVINVRPHVIGAPGQEVITVYYTIAIDGRESTITVVGHERLRRSKMES